MKHKLSKRLMTLLTIAALLLLILPAGLLFADSIAAGGKKPDQSSIQPSQSEAEKPDVEEEEEEAGDPSEQAAIVAERIATAREMGISPGHLNGIDKLLAAKMAAEEQTTISDEDKAAFRLLWRDASSQAINQEIASLRFEAKGKEFPGAKETEAPAGETEETAKKNNGQGKGNDKK